MKRAEARMQSRFWYAVDFIITHIIFHGLVTIPIETTPALKEYTAF